MSLTTVTLSGIKWSAAGRLASQVLQFGLSIYLMRALGPESFGLVGIVMIFSGFAGVISDFGFSAALVQRRELTKQHQYAAFWLNLLTSILLFAVLSLSSPLIAKAYGDPQLQPLTVWIGLGLVLGSCGSVPQALLRRNMQFRTLAVIDVTAAIAAAAVAFFAAFSGAGVWSLVAQALTRTGCASLLLLKLGNFTPGWARSSSAIRDLFAYGTGLTGYNIVNYWARTVDNLVIGIVFGPVALGIYSKAYSLMLLPTTQFISVLSPVMFPALSSVQHDPPRVRRAFLRTLSVLSLFTFPTMIGLAAVAPVFVVGLLGESWIEVIPIIQILAFVGICQSVCGPTGWIYRSQGRTDWLFWWGVFGGGFLVAAILFGAFLGSVRTLALSYLVANILLTGPCLIVPGRLIGMSLTDVWRATRGNLLAAMAMGGIVHVAALAIADSMPPVAALTIEVALGVVSYTMLARLLDVQAVRELRATLASRRSDRLAR